MRLASTLSLAAFIAFSSTSWSNSQFEEEFSSPAGSTPQLSLSGSVQPSRHYAGQAHALIPVWESEEADISGYGYLTGQASAQGWSIGAGGGVRATLEHQLTIGGYGLIEHQRSERGNRFWRFSPGIELQGEGWHLSANAYLPIGQNKYRNEFSLYSATLGSTELEFSRFEGHTGFLTSPFSYIESWESGIQGVDLVGRWQLSDPFTLSLGGYYLPSETQSRLGIVAGIAYQVNAFSLEIQGHQDQVERQVQARVSWHLGTTPEAAASTRQRLKLLQRPGAEWAKLALIPNAEVPQDPLRPPLPEGTLPQDPPPKSPPPKDPPPHFPDDAPPRFPGQDR